MSSPQMPPWLQEQIGKLQQSQQNLQSIMTQRQHLEMEKAETEKAIDELKKVADGDSVKQGDVVCTLESMKMQVAVKAHKDGSVKSIKVKEAGTVAKGDLIAEIE